MPIDLRPAVYLSAPSAEIERAREVRETLTRHGVRVVGGDWIEEVEALGSEASGAADRDLVPCIWRQWIRQAHALLVLAPLGTTTSGVYRELEQALSLDVPVIVSCCAPYERVPLALLDREARVQGRWHHELDDQSAVMMAVRVARREARS
jgi:hypothetical protein